MSLAAANRREQDALKGKLILDWLLFPARLEYSESQALLAAAAESIGEPVPEPLTALEPHAQADPEDQAAYRAFASHVEAAHLSGHHFAAREDVRVILAQIGEEGRPQKPGPQIGLIELLRRVTRLFGIDIYIERGSVRVSLDSLSGWYQVIDRLDAEALLCLKLAELGFAEEVAELDQWSLVTLISDRDLDSLVGQGVSDMHQHLGGLRSAHLIWLQLMAGGVKPEQVTYFDRATMASLAADPFSHRSRTLERQRIERLAAAHRQDCEGQLWRYFFEPLGQLRDCVTLSGEATEAPRPDIKAVHDLVLRERVMLARGFARLIALAEAGTDARLQGQAHRLEHALDLYLHTKSRFISNHRQAIRSNPGLGRHRQFADSTKIGWGWEARPAPPRSAEVRSYDYAEAVHFIAQSPALRRVELRLAPGDIPQDYTRFLEAWSLVEDRLKRDIARPAGAMMPDIRFSIHFKRSLDRRKGDRQESRMRNFLKDLDIHSAALHEFRLDMHDDTSGAAGSPPIVSRIARIDFAGQERDIFPDRAAFSMNLLRSDADALAMLEGRTTGFRPSPEFHGRWLELKEKGRVQMPVRLPRLGVTCHAGEDYAHPLEGLHAMITAVEALKMRAGDSIGHGLAIGRDVAAFHRDVAPHLMTSRGGQFDALAWLQATLVTHAPAEHVQAAARINAWLWQKVSDIYPPHPDLASMTTFGQVARLRRGPVPDEHPRPKTLAAQIWWSECWNPSVRAERLFPEPLASVLYEIEPSIVWAQEFVAREIARRGVVVELNPSSNWRISQARRPSDIPFVSILTRFGDFIVACINTDNAGAYGTRIENEYAIALVGLMEAGMSRTQAIALLDRLRLAGLNRLH